MLVTDFINLDGSGVRGRGSERETGMYNSFLETPVSNDDYEEKEKEEERTITGLISGVRMVKEKKRN